MKRAHFVILFFFQLQLFFVAGQPYAVNIKDINSLPPSDYPIYIDTNQHFNSSTITQQNFEKIFNSSLNNVENHKHTSFWIAIGLKNLKSNRLIQIYALNAKEVNAYQIMHNDEARQIKCSKRRNDFHILKVNPSIKLVLINIKTTTPLQLSIKSFTENEFFLKERKFNLYYGFIIGVFLLLALYHLVLFIKVQDKLYLYYIVLIIISGLLAVPHSGFVHTNTHLYYDIVFTLFQISCLLIAINYLNLFKKSRKPLWVFTALILVANIYDIIAPSSFGKYLSHAVCLFIYLFILYTTWQQIRANKSHATLFTLPWITLFIAHVYYLLNLEIVLYYRQPIEIGLFANICLMALAIGNKLNIYKDQKKNAESNELKAILERDKIIHEQNLILEQLIQERHKKILEKNHALSEKQNEIEEKNDIFNNSNHQLRTINQQLVNKNNEILAQNQELKKHHELLEIIVNKRTKKLLAAKERAIVADKLKTSFLNNLTHEINAPMNLITGFANLLNNKDLTKKKRNEYLGNINKNVDILLESIDNVVVLARIQARILKPKSRDFVIKDIKTRCREVFSEKLKLQNKSNIEFIIKSTGVDEETVLFSDFEKIWQILYKLLDNSVIFTKDGQIMLNYTIKKTDEQEPKRLLVLKVEDTGVGIEKDKLDFLLERFSNKEDDKTKLYHKTGIGLAIVKGLVDLLNGSINVHSTYGKGTLFHIEIPVKIKPNLVQN
jgi:signal transduction histidine kinase